MSELQTRPGADVLESVIVQGDLSNLTPQQRIEYYLKVCDSLGLNPVTRPFAYLTLKQGCQKHVGSKCARQGKVD